MGSARWTAAVDGTRKNRILAVKEIDIILLGKMLG